MMVTGDYYHTALAVARGVSTTFFKLPPHVLALVHRAEHGTPVNAAFAARACFQFL